jgi:hypothetical protein
MVIFYNRTFDEKIHLPLDHVKGRIRTIRINSLPTSPWVAVLDFGNGNCDNLAIITINGVPHQITLP